MAKKSKSVKMKPEEILAGVVTKGVPNSHRRCGSYCGNCVLARDVELRGHNVKVAGLPTDPEELVPALYDRCSGIPCSTWQERNGVRLNEQQWQFYRMNGRLPSLAEIQALAALADTKTGAKPKSIKVDEADLKPAEVDFGLTEQRIVPEEHWTRKAKPKKQPKKRLEVAIDADIDWDAL